MKQTNKLMLMIAKFLYEECDAQTFSFEFPEALATAHGGLYAENAALCDFLEENTPELCASFDAFDTGDPETVNEQVFRAAMLAIYQEALPMSLKSAS